MYLIRIGNTIHVFNCAPKITVTKNKELQIKRRGYSNYTCRTFRVPREYATVSQYVLYYVQLD